ncbi:MAG TPA: hypothetical protein VG983_04155 [Caulobacterales bacterium]|nr:hypothetical protein [Caulobacterales bacterium]
MSAARILAGLIGAAFLMALVAAVAQTDTLEDLRYELQALFDQPWALASLANLYAGFALFAIIIALVERSLVSALIWAAPMLVLGNAWAALWLLIRLPRLAERLLPPPAA